MVVTKKMNTALLENTMITVSERSTLPTNRSITVVLNAVLNAITIFTAIL